MLESFSRQTERCRLLIWNNNKRYRDRLIDIVAKSRDDLDLTPGVSLYHHSPNVGGFGRFYAARDMVETEYVAFIDDDWCMKPELLGHLYASRKPKSISGLWCWKYPTPNDRARAVSGPCDYVGTCGMVVPRALFEDRRIFDDIPNKYWFIEDIWLCFFAQYELGYRVLSCGKLEQFARNMNRDDRGQLIEKVPGLAGKVWDLKPKFLKFLFDKYK